MRIAARHTVTGCGTVALFRTLHEALIFTWNAHRRIVAPVDGCIPIGELWLNGHVDDAVLCREEGLDGLKEKRVLASTQPRKHNVTRGDNVGRGETPNVKFVNVLKSGKLR